MSQPTLTIFYQFDPWGTSIGGIQTIVRSFIKYGHDEFNIRLVGIEDDPNAAMGIWREAEFEGKRIQFLSLFAVPDDNVRGLIPTTIKYTAALLGKDFSSDFVHFHRLEPTLASLKWSGDKTLFIHNDIRKQMTAAEDKKAILWRRFPGVYFALERTLVQQFDQIFSCNSESAAWYQQQYPVLADRVSFLKNTVDNEIFFPWSAEECDRSRRELAQKLGINEDSRFILFAGRLHPQKDPILLVRSIAALDDSNVHLLIAGEGELRSEIQMEISQLGLTKQVTMLGPVAQRELSQLHRIADAFILTSSYEGLPLVALEALACGTPVITTRCGETPNLLSVKSGFVVQERTPNAIAEAIRKILSNLTAYPPEACVHSAQPYGAQAVISSVYEDMLKRWKKRLMTV
ncbi:MAG: glycosyltransferase family 4 protein [Gloeobacterales cyanobacterium]